MNWNTCSFIFLWNYNIELSITIFFIILRNMDKIAIWNIYLQLTYLTNLYPSRNIEVLDYLKSYLVKAWYDAIINSNFKLFQINILILCIWNQLNIHNCSIIYKNVERIQLKKKLLWIGDTYINSLKWPKRNQKFQFKLITWYGEKWQALLYLNLN